MGIINEHYILEKKSPFRYDFISEGPNGEIIKTIQYTKMYTSVGYVFSLGFGDWDKKKNIIDDTAVSNNNDRNKILETVAISTTYLLNDYPDATIYAIGSTPVRTRLYQMSIAGRLTDISKEFEIKGLINNQWKLFQKGENYNAFLLKTKKTILSLTNN